MQTVTIPFEDIWLDGSSEPLAGTFDFDFDAEQIVEINIDTQGEIASTHKLWQPVALQILQDNNSTLQSESEAAGIYGGWNYDWSMQAIHQMGLDGGEPLVISSTEFDVRAAA